MRPRSRCLSKASLSGPANSSVGLPAEPGCTFWQVKEREPWVWRSVGVQSLLSAGRGRTGKSQRHRCQSAAPVHVLLWCHPRSAGHTLSWWGCCSVEGSPRASHPLTPSGISYTVLELHGLTALVSPVSRFLSSSSRNKFVSWMRSRGPGTICPTPTVYNAQ